MTTIILLNPMGTDVTSFVDGTNPIGQLLKGTIRKPGDAIVTIPYINQPGRQNVADGVEMLHAAILNAINNGATDILVVGYSEGCQIADWWLWKYGQSTPVDPAQLRFWLIANANRKYGGFVCGHTIFDTVGYTNGKPADTPYQVIDFTRQYDGVSDFPTAQPVQNALIGLQTVGSDQNAIVGAMNAVGAVLADNVHKTAALNAINGLLWIHNIYLYVTLDDPANRELKEGNITWVWSPTYPVPLLGLSTMFSSSDREKRILIEQAYQRPVEIPMPNYGSGPAWGQPAAPSAAAPVTGWWAPVRASRGKGSGAYRFAGLGASGLRQPRAAGAGAFGFAGTAIGRRLARAVATAGQYGFTAGPAVGDDNVRQASAAGGYRFIGGPAVGMSSSGRGFALGAYTFTAGAAIGRRMAKAIAAGAYSFGGAATGRKAPRAAAAGNYVFAGSATGRRTPRAAAAGAYTFAAAAVGRVTRRGSASGSYTFAGTATGVTPPTFQPFDEINANKTGTTPIGCAGVWVELQAPGGGGGRGFYTASAVGRGGAGGAGGGARIFRVFIPVALLGSTYTINWSAGGASQTDGVTITFTSGGVTLTVTGGLKGNNGGSGVGGTGGAGGTWSATGLSGVTGANGTAGGRGANDNNQLGTAGANNTAGAGPGGGGGSGLGAFGGTNTSGKGGNSTTANGGAAATSLNNGNPGANGTGGNAGGGGSGGAALNGNVSGSGGKGGTAGAGGGGSSGNADPNAQGAPGGQGGDAWTKLEWVATAP